MLSSNVVDRSYRSAQSPAPGRHHKANLFPDLKVIIAAMAPLYAAIEQKKSGLCTAAAMRRRRQPPAPGLCRVTPCNSERRSLDLLDGGRHVKGPIRLLKGPNAQTAGRTTNASERKLNTKSQHQMNLGPLLPSTHPTSW